MIIDSLRALFERDLNRLYKEIDSYKDDADLWEISGDIANSGGNLALHLIGNLKSYIGVVYGKRSYERHRELEFSQKNIPKQELLTQILETKESVLAGLSNLSPEELSGEYPLLVFKEKTSVVFFLIHLQGHLNYHLGQINYHRRLLGS